MTPTTSVGHQQGVTIVANPDSAQGDLLTPNTVAFLADLQRQFNPRRIELLDKRRHRQTAIDAGLLPDFLPETRSIREEDWKVAPIPPDLQDRRVEITGPTDRKMVINALNSGAKCFMADFEDSNSPTWSNLLEGQRNLRDAVRRTISFVSPEGKPYKLNSAVATLLVRPRGWHLPERHMLVDGEPMSGSLFDFGLYFFHNAKHLLDNGSGPYFYLPKLENHLEARLWNDVFNFAQDAIHIPRGSIRATVLIEHILAAFEADEILYELRDHSAGLNCGRWDYIFSFIKKFAKYPDRVLPDRSQVTMTSPFMRAYALHVIKTCHRRGIHAMGGMAAQIPIRNDNDANESAIAKVRADKRREVEDGHDGTWVAHPGLVPVAMDIFDEKMPTANQIDRQRDDVCASADELLSVPDGSITEHGLRTNISIGVQYMESWLGGNGCVPLYNLMEDAATAEISRTQVWQWIRHDKGVLDDGRKISVELFRALLGEELAKIRNTLGDERFMCGKYQQAAELFDKISTADALEEFLTIPAYDVLAG